MIWGVLGGNAVGGHQEPPVSTDIHQPLSLKTDINRTLFLHI